MKKLFFTALALSMALLGKAQLVEVASMERVATPEGLVSEIATISPDGSFAIVGQLGNSQLTKVDLSNGSTEVVATNGNAFDVAISPDGANLVYRTTAYSSNHLRLTGINSVNLVNGSEKQLVKPSRKLNAGVAVNATGITAVENGKQRVKAFGSAKATAIPVASIHYGHLNVTVNGKTKTIDPQGKGSYLWPSISPDGTKVVYCLSGKGTFVCDLNGGNVRKIGYMHAAKWLGDDMVVGMADYDNGHEYTSSTIVVSNLNGVKQTITNDDMIALYPSASADGKNLVFSTSEGALYRVNLK